MPRLSCYTIFHRLVDLYFFVLISRLCQVSQTLGKIIWPVLYQTEGHEEIVTETRNTVIFMGGA